MHLVNKNDIPLLQFPHFKKFGKVFHSFTTRQGGGSKGPFESLNLGFHTDDLYQRVLHNRKKLFSALGWKLESVVTPIQVHGKRVTKVNKKHKGRGAYDLESALPAADGLITNEKGILLMINVADCFPVFLYDPANQALGLIHAGWQGTAKGVIGKGIEAMMTSFGSQPKTLKAGVGPGINKCCYQVGKDLLKKFGNQIMIGNSGKQSGERGDSYLDLKRIIFSQLIECGLKENNVEVAAECTCCNSELFFSHRRDKGKTGRMAALIGLKN